MSNGTFARVLKSIKKSPDCKNPNWGPDGAKIDIEKGKSAPAAGYFLSKSKGVFLFLQEGISIRLVLKNALV